MVRYVQYFIVVRLFNNKQSPKSINNMVKIPMNLWRFKT